MTKFAEVNVRWMNVSMPANDTLDRELLNSSRSAELVMESLHSSDRDKKSVMIFKRSS